MSDALPEARNQKVFCATLSTIGIKVRDFAYESVLPPIPSIPYIPVQVQPEPRPLKRARDSEWSNVGGSTTRFPRHTFFCDSEGRSESYVTYEQMEPKPIARKDTEPDVSSQSPTREIGHSAASLPLIISQNNDVHFVKSPTPTTLTSTINSTGQASSSPSQKPEGWIDTPIATPSGSSFGFPMGRSIGVLTPQELVARSPQPEDTATFHSTSHIVSSILPQPSPPRVRSHRPRRTPNTPIFDPAASGGSKEPSPRYYLRNRTRLDSSHSAETSIDRRNAASPYRKNQRGTTASSRTRVRPRLPIAQR